MIKTTTTLYESNEIRTSNQIIPAYSTQFSDEEPSLTQQHMSAETDVNNIVKHYEKTGLLKEVGQGYFGDFSNLQDYQSSLNAVMTAQDAFMALPAQVRAEFENDPAQLIAFLSNPLNRDEAIKMGFVEKPTLTSQEVAKPLDKPADTSAS